ncbi:MULTISPECIES: hypothetical protein [Sinorhizobium]|uniref:Uncharacterized protein n=1 Tax=Sinorhizobium medicae TaxID=110321 RepID=A0A508WSN8_9HYPH|nr:MULTISPECIES: hypothetical protein [Sinorhizobium]MDE3766144.1 hypothetical protein [Sinorhizobium meliloti]MDE3781230.1 hypothetical protein [Sinorhizobium meliloti]MDE3804007.1 hypothetical protein [Sinorhizobium meliloti]MDX0524996.1 hypothetical protein [Sinorhizobium medicae]MDX0549429.1 hypothetical protein [Sinorhizobium medicae]
METPRTPAEAMQHILCDRLIEACAETMFDEVRAPVEVVIQRLAAYTLAQLIKIEGRNGAAHILRDIAQQVEDGALNAYERGKGN